MSQQTLPFDPPPAQRHSQTSIEAAKAIAPKRSDLQQLVFAAIRDSGRNGLTDERIAQRLGIDQNTSRPRRVELAHQGVIRPCGATRETSRRRKATVWVTARAACEHEYVEFAIPDRPGWLRTECAVCEHWRGDRPEAAKT